MNIDREFAMVSPAKSATELDPALARALGLGLNSEGVTIGASVPQTAAGPTPICGSLDRVGEALTRSTVSPRTSVTANTTSVQPPLPPPPSDNANALQAAIAALGANTTAADGSLRSTPDNHLAALLQAQLASQAGSSSSSLGNPFGMGLAGGTQQTLDLQQQLIQQQQQQAAALQQMQMMALLQQQQQQQQQQAMLQQHQFQQQQQHQLQSTSASSASASHPQIDQLAAGTNPLSSLHHHGALNMGVLNNPPHNLGGMGLGLGLGGFGGLGGMSVGLGLGGGGGGGGLSMVALQIALQQQQQQLALLTAAAKQRQEEQLKQQQQQLLLQQQHQELLRAQALHHATPPEPAVPFVAPALNAFLPLSSASPTGSALTPKKESIQKIRVDKSDTQKEGVSAPSVPFAEASASSKPIPSSSSAALPAPTSTLSSSNNTNTNKSSPRSMTDAASPTTTSVAKNTVAKNVIAVGGAGARAAPSAQQTAKPATLAGKVSPNAAKQVVPTPQTTTKNTAPPVHSQGAPASKQALTALPSGKTPIITSATTTSTVGAASANVTSSQSKSVATTATAKPSTTSAAFSSPVHAKPGTSTSSASDPATRTSTGPSVVSKAATSTTAATAVSASTRGGVSATEAVGVTSKPSTSAIENKDRPSPSTIATTTSKAQQQGTAAAGSSNTEREKKAVVATISPPRMFCDLCKTRTHMTEDCRILKRQAAIDEAREKKRETEARERDRRELEALKIKLALHQQRAHDGGDNAKSRRGGMEREPPRAMANRDNSRERHRDRSRDRDRRGARSPSREREDRTKVRGRVRSRSRTRSRSRSPPRGAAKSSSTHNMIDDRKALASSTPQDSSNHRAEQQQQQHSKPTSSTTATTKPSATSTDSYRTPKTTSSAAPQQPLSMARVPVVAFSHQIPSPDYSLPDGPYSRGQFPIGSAHPTVVVSTFATPDERKADLRARFDQIVRQCLESAGPSSPSNPSTACFQQRLAIPHLIDHYSSLSTEESINEWHDAADGWMLRTIAIVFAVCSGARDFDAMFKASLAAAAQASRNVQPQLGEALEHYWGRVFQSAGAAIGFRLAY